jgi:hypothetical protein
MNPRASLGSHAGLFAASLATLTLQILPTRIFSVTPLLASGIGSARVPLLASPA